AAAGKSTLAKNLAQKLGILYLDTGATYRAAALFAIEQNTDLEDSSACAEVVGNCEIDLQSSLDGEIRVILNGRDVTEEIRRNDVSEAASRISVHPEVRKALVELQRKIAGNRDVVAEGRDTGSVVFPHADLKIYLDAPLEERVIRREKDLKNSGHEKQFDEIKNEMLERDRRDMTRKDSPLVCLTDAVYINNGRYSAEESLQSVLMVVETMRNSLK
ncbi:(d)CMP kinase, partial [bacterium]|nr:(d)CMP kinase [bacterium]MBU1024710.1 (d)CMP kinase [bacterium]